jgi:hypothetical protein
MSLKILLEDQITQLFMDNPELSNVQKNKFEIAVASFPSPQCLFKVLCLAEDIAAFKEQKL